MNAPRSVAAGASLVVVALLIGGLALLTVAGQETLKDEPQAKAASKSKNNKKKKAAAPATPAEAAPAASAEPASTTVIQPGVVQTLAAAAEIASQRDAAFDYYVDVALLGQAWVDLDAPLITDVALQLMEGERVLLRPHRLVASTDVMEVAIRLAAVKNDQPTLERLGKAIERSGDEKLAAMLAAAKSELADADAATVWTVSVATTSAADFARYKGVLQDLEAAIVVRDRVTLENLQKELESRIDLPKEHQTRLAGRVKKALAGFEAQEPTVSKAAGVLDKLAHATRTIPGMNVPAATIPSASTGGGARIANLLRVASGALAHSGGNATMFPSLATVCPTATECPSVQTQCPATLTACQQVSTTCPGGSVATQCPAVMTQCPPNCQQVTQFPSGPTQCQNVQTVCPQTQTSCPANCQQVTQFPSGPTQCQNVQTVCPQWQTYCPQNCQQETQYPSTPTQCQMLQTICPQNCQQETQYPTTPTQCQMLQTICPQNCQQETQYPSTSTQCQAVTQYPSYPTACQPSKGKGTPTMYPSIPTQCPSIMTQCPASPTLCPANCGGQQQQQKQKWTPPGGGFSPGQEAAPYQRRNG